MEWAAGDVVKCLSWEVYSCRLDNPFVCREGGGDVNREYLPKIVGLYDRWCDWLPPSSDSFRVTQLKGKRASPERRVQETG